MSVGACVLDSAEPSHAPESCRIHDMEVQDHFDAHHVRRNSTFHRHLHVSDPCMLSSFFRFSSLASGTTFSARVSKVATGSRTASSTLRRERMACWCSSTTRHQKREPASRPSQVYIWRDVRNCVMVAINVICLFAGYTQPRNDDPADMTMYAGATQDDGHLYQSTCE